MQRRQFVTRGLSTLAVPAALLPLAAPAELLGASSEAGDGAERRQPHGVLTLDVANDLRRFAVNGGRTLFDARRGDGFITEGRIYPGGTIEPGGTMTEPGPFNPDTAPGAIGLWHCRGTFIYDFAEILNGAEPHVVATQFLLLANGDGLVTDGPEGGPVTRTLVGGMGRFTGAEASVFEQPIGTNVTGLFNVRFTFRFERRP